MQGFEQRYLLVSKRFSWAIQFAVYSVDESFVCTAQSRSFSMMVRAPAECPSASD